MTPLSPPDTIEPAKQTVRPEAADALISAGKGSLLNGQSQYFTPAPVAAAIGAAFNFYTPPRCVLDPCGIGDGSLATNLFGHGPDIYGVEIDPVAAAAAEAAGCNVITGSITDAFPVLAALKHFSPPCVVTNPPFSLRWKTGCLAPLASHRCDALRLDFADLSNKPYVDASVASFLICLALLEYNSHGAVILNRSTYEKRIAPLSSAGHVRAVVQVPKKSWPGVGASLVVVFLTRTAQPSPPEIVEPRDLAAFTLAATPGSKTHTYSQGYHELWKLADAEHAARHKRAVPAYNISLEDNGLIRAYVTPFQQKAGTFDYRQAYYLKELDGKNPAAVVIDSGQRQALLDAVSSGIYTVAPNVLDAVRTAITEYQAARAPLYQLPPVKRIGYLDEADAVTCKKSAGPFREGQRYAVQTITVPTSRKIKVRNVTNGKLEQVERHGRDLLVRIHHNPPGVPSLGHTDYFAASKGFVPATGERADSSITFDAEKFGTMTAFLRTFDVPEVPDVASQDPDAYTAAKKTIAEIGRAVHARVPDQFKEFSPFQVEDFARGSLTDGFIKAWEQGMGKSMALGVMPLLWGTRLNLIVAPESLHPQLVDHQKKFFGVDTHPLLTVADIARHPALVAAVCGRPHTGAPLYFITSYTALGSNGGDMWPDKGFSNKTIAQRRRSLVKSLGADTVKAALALARDAINRERAEDPDMPQLGELTQTAYLFDGVGTRRHGIRCIAQPTIAQITSHAFDLVMLDEGVRLKGTASLQSKGVRTMCPARRVVLTGTPAKNRIPDLFWLALWACGGADNGTPRWPYANDPASHSEFEREFTLCEENITRAQEHAANNGGERRTFRKQIPQITDVHRLWKLIGPVIIRRRKSDIADQLVKKTTKIVNVKMGTSQARVYHFHCGNPPEQTKDGRPLDDDDFKDRVAAIGMQVQNLRNAALAPWDIGLTRFHTPANINACSPADGITPKLLACLETVKANLLNGQQTIVLSPFTAFNTRLHQLLVSGGVATTLLDGRVKASRRGEEAELFKAFRYAALVGGIKAVGEGLSFPRCQNIILPSLSWALDENAQAIERIWRLNSEADITVTLLVTEGTIDERILQAFEEKRDNADLGIDGTTFHNHAEQINQWDLLADARKRLATGSDYHDEADLLATWTASGKEAMRLAFRHFSTVRPEVLDKAPVTLASTVDARPSAARKTPRRRTKAGAADTSTSDAIARYKAMLAKLDSDSFHAAIANCANG